MENHNHLFFSCNYSAKVWGAISDRARIIWPRTEWILAWDLMVDRTRSENSARKKMVGIVIAATVYHLWQERNKRIYDHHFTGTERLIDEINFSIRGRLANLDRADELPETWLKFFWAPSLHPKGCGPVCFAGLSSCQSIWRSRRRVLGVHLRFAGLEVFWVSTLLKIAAGLRFFALGSLSFGAQDGWAIAEEAVLGGCLRASLKVAAGGFGFLGCGFF
ncbi:hypothetical protein OIU74_009760 [Salix koriyanagi]|uniref:Reverse transcriptase zinc-binding domain-containing protein n=1 Tax=Salix koriyanagi TaxID=2511006 RepID=A0A9Q0TT29_9ROSI|nr:hypothetical protein OIU74_009760 [Salix koriyanagi]